MIKKTQMSFLKFMYASVMIKDRKVAELLEDMANIKYRHMIWVMTDARIKGEKFNMDIDDLSNLKVNNAKELIEILKDDVNSILSSIKGENPTEKRLISDNEYFLEQLNEIDIDEEITAFNENRKLDNIEIDEEATNALVFFLMEESFKEYELITIYSYLKVYSDNPITTYVFGDLALDSIYHFKRFTTLAAKMGVLTFIRSIPHEKYESIGVTEFLKENIEEEQDAEKQCLILAEKIGNKQLSDFLLFISRQEVYHAELLERALQSVKQ